MNQLISELVLSSSSLRFPRSFKSHLLHLTLFHSTNTSGARWKGKGRAQDLEKTEETGDYEGSFGRSAPPIRPNALRQKHILAQNSCLRPVQFRTSPSFIMFSRCIASTATIPKRQSATYSTSGASDDLTRFRSSISKQDVHKAWDAYFSLRDRGDISSQLRSNELLSLAHLSATDDVLLALAKKHSAKEAFQRWGEQLACIEADLRNGYTGSSADTFGRRCALLASLALKGDMSGVLLNLDSLVGFVNSEQHCEHAVDLFRVILYAVCAHDSPTASLNFFLNHHRLFRRILDHKGEKGPQNRSIDQNSPFTRAFSFCIPRISNLEDYIRDWAATDSADKLRLVWMTRILLRVLCNQHNCSLQALSAYEAFTRNGVPVEYRLTLELVRALAKEDHYHHANPIFSTVKPEESDVKAYYEETGLYLFSRQGDMEESQKLYDRLVSRRGANPAFATHILVASARSGGVTSVMKTFDEAFNSRTKIIPNHHHFGVVINAFVEENDTAGMNDWIARMADAGFPPDLATFNTVLKMFAAREDFESLRSLLEHMRGSGIQPDLTSYTIIIALLARRRDPIAAEEVYRRIIDEGMNPDTRAVAAIMNAHVEAGSWGGVIRAFDFFRSASPSFRRARLDISIVNTLLKAYVLIGAPLDRVTTIFQSLGANHLKPSDHTFALLIQSACEAGRMDVAARLFVEMERLASDWTTALHVNAYAMTILMSGYLRLGEKSRAKAIYEDMVQRGVEPTSVTYNAIISAYANEKSEDSIKVALDFLKTITTDTGNKSMWKAPKHGFLTPLEHIHNPLLYAFSKKLNAGEVERLYEEMLAIDGGKPTIASLTLLLDAYRRSGDIDSVEKLWAEIFELGLKFFDADAVLSADEQRALQLRTQRRTDVLAVPLSIYVDAMSASGRHVEIAETWVLMQARGFQFDAHNWNHLVVALVRAGQPARAFHIVENVILKYKSQAEFKSRERPEEVDSPLLFTSERDAEAALSEPPIPNDRAAGRRAVLVARTRHLEIPRNEDEADYAHDLQVLQQISPAWNIWRPHNATLSVLSDTLNRLESGRLLEQSTQSDDPNAEMQEAIDLARRIHETYPQTVDYIHSWERRNRYSRRRSQFFDDHTEESVTNIRYN
ncbi:hypothetical protein SCHPADRAFT_1002962 [Schizopora paradoxa]|uniref:PROP1-like PPR domain-containing protein n=1 Tax=Schizopora paradoxa TaxID=27342 RepID=A0A0H2R1Z0_9AGAM|nr:hypothetical protein SCHPADRAFT_1002962 [Schizopora paradoxa]